MNRNQRIFCLLMALLMLCVSSSALAARATATPNPDAIVEPTLSPDANTYDAEHPEDLEADQLYALSAILVETATGEAIFEKDPDTLRAPASTTKIMTVWLGITMLEDLDFTVVCSERAVDVPSDSTKIGLKAGEEINYRDLLYATMLLSGNDGANVIAETVAGSIEAFVDLMNQKAWELGCFSTHFTNPHGYPDDMHYSSARDLAVIAAAAMENNTFRAIARSYSYSLPKTNMSRARSITNTNELMRNPSEENGNKYYYPYAVGMKTGTSKSSGYCFVGAAEKDGVTLISVVMFTGKRARWADTIKLMEYGYSQYTSVSPIDLYNMNPITLETSGYALDDPNMGKLPLICQAANAESAKAKIVATFSQVDAMANHLHDTVIIQYDRDFAAPIEAGEVMGTMSYFTENGDLAEYNLVASRTIARRANAPKTLAEIKAEVEADTSILPPITPELIFFALLPLVVIALIIWLILHITRRIKKHMRGAPKATNRHLK